MEIWKPTAIEGYEVSSYGRVKAKERIVEYIDGRVGKFKERMIKPMLTKKGYYKVHLSSNKVEGYRTSSMVHRLVALAFIPNPENKPQVNHKDGNKLNNHVGNLEWATNTENHAHKLMNNLIPETHIPKRVRASKDGQIIKEFDSLYQAGKWAKPEMDPAKSSDKISQVARGKRKTAWGYVWNFV